MIAVVVPVLGRPQNAQPLADSLNYATTCDYTLVFVCSPDDKEEIAACIQATPFHGYVMVADWQPCPGDFARKVNLAYAETDADWIFQAADDVTFQPGWDTALLACHERTGALVIGSNDDANPTVKRGHHSTHSLIARSYIDDPGASMDGPGTVFSTAYAHAYCDNELVQLAKHRGVWAWAGDSHVTHHHWVWGTAPKDETYERGAASMREDGRIYQQRSRMWTRGGARV